MRLTKIGVVGLLLGLTAYGCGDDGGSGSGGATGGEAGEGSGGGSTGGTSTGGVGTGGSSTGGSAGDMGTAGMGGMGGGGELPTLEEACESMCEHFATLDCQDFSQQDCEDDCLVESEAAVEDECESERLDFLMCAHGASDETIQCTGGYIFPDDCEDEEDAYWACVP